MTPEQLSSMTLGDAEAMATRLEVAARTIREAMSLMGGGANWPQVVETTRTGDVAAMTRPTFAPNPAHVLTPSEQAEKARLMRQIRGPELPSDIEAAEEA